MRETEGFTSPINPTVFLFGLAAARAAGGPRPDSTSSRGNTLCFLKGPPDHQRKPEEGRCRQSGRRGLAPTALLPEETRCVSSKAHRPSKKAGRRAVPPERREGPRPDSASSRGNTLCFLKGPPTIKESRKKGGAARAAGGPRPDSTSSRGNTLCFLKSPPTIKESRKKGGAARAAGGASPRQRFFQRKHAVFPHSHSIVATGFGERS